MDAPADNRPQKRLGFIEIANVLRREIRGGLFAPKERLPTGRMLSETYRVARGTIRQALIQLANENLIDIRPGSGVYVKFGQALVSGSAIQEASPLELIDTRFALEPHICRLAALNAKREDLRKADELIVSMENSVDDPISFSNADTEFHTLLSETTGNGLLIWIISEINAVRNQEQWSRMRKLTLDCITITQYTLEHKKILEAIKARTPEIAANLMKDHLENARSSLTHPTLN